MISNFAQIINFTPKTIKTIFYIALLSLAILIGLVYFAPIAFTACAPNSLWCHLAYWFTSSGGPLGFFLLLLLTGFSYTLSEQSIKQKTIVFLKSIISLCLFFGVLALINERYTKPILKSQRPSHVYMLSQTNHIEAIDSLYSLTKEERKLYFANLIKNNPLSFTKIDPEIQQHWIKEAGFSFPSGHTFNAFLFAMILSYAIYKNRSKAHLKNLFFMPFVWAILVAVSRVSVGAHTALDVSAGAALGIGVGMLFLYIDFSRHWLTRKN